MDSGGGGTGSGPSAGAGAGAAAGAAAAAGAGSRVSRHRWLRFRRRLEVMVGGPQLLLAILIVLGLFALCGILLFIVEHGVNESAAHLKDCFGWVFITLLDKEPWEPVTATGKAVYYAIEILRPISIGLIIASLTTRIVQFLLSRTQGGGRVRLKDHIVICGWSGKGPEIINELRGRGDAEAKRAVVILAALKDNPSRDSLTTFVHGDPTKAEDLERAGIKAARSAIVVADNSYPDIDVEEMDSRTLLSALAIETLSPNVYTVVEVIRSENLDHFARTKADELVVSARLTGALLAHSAATPGLSDVVGELLTFPKGNEFYWIPVPADQVGRKFLDCMMDLKSRLNCLPIALRTDGQDVVTNPAIDCVLAAGDRLLVIAQRYPDQLR
jgi:voltage-gated potassium channel